MNTNSIISDIRNIASSGSNPIEYKIEDSQILFWVNETRSMLISQALKARQDISDTWVQVITCLSLDQVDKSECCLVNTNCFVLRTRVKLPRTIETSYDNTIIRVTKPDGTIIPKRTAFSSLYNSYSKYAKDKAYWYLKDDYIYVVNEDLLETINVWGLFENPSELSTFVACSGTPCFSLESSYPCSLKMASDITNIVIKTKVYPYLQLPADNRNDGVNNPDVQSNIKQ